MPHRASDGAAGDRQSEIGPDAAERLFLEHQWFRSEMAELQHRRWPPERRRRFRELVRRAVRHEVAEEEIVHPLLRRVDGGKAVRRTALEQERDLAFTFARLLRRMLWRPGGRTTRERLALCAEQLEAHLAFEERTILPLLVELEFEQQRRVLGTWIGFAERFAPTLPHPHAPRRLPGLLLVGPLFALGDRLLARAVPPILRDEAR